MAARLLSAAALPAASAICMSLRTNANKINDIIRECKASQVGCMQQALEEIIARCIEEGFAYKKNVQGYQCGIHPENRAKSGVDPVDAQNLALKISQDGYTEAKLEITMCFEKAQAGTIFGMFLSKMRNTSR